MADRLGTFAKGEDRHPGKTMVLFRGFSPGAATTVFVAVLSHHLKSPDRIGWTFMAFAPCPKTLLPFDARPETKNSPLPGRLVMHTVTHHVMAGILAKHIGERQDFAWDIQQLNYSSSEVGVFKCYSFKGPSERLYGEVPLQQGPAASSTTADSDDDDISFWKNAMKEKVPAPREGADLPDKTRGSIGGHVFINWPTPSFQKDALDLTLNS